MARAVILLVEDETFTRKMMALQLEKAGFEVVQAVHGREGLDRVTEQEFDLILSDMVMPEMDGMAFLVEVRKDPKLSKVPFILLTGKENPEEMETSLAAGADDFVTKSKAFSLVLHRVRLHLELRRRREQQDADPVRVRKSGDEVWIWDFKNGRMRFSKGWLALLGYEDFPETPNAWIAHIHTEDRVRVVEAMENHKAGKSGHFEQDFRFQTGSGDFCWVHAFGVAAFDARRNPLRLIGSMCLLAPTEGTRAKAESARDAANRLQTLLSSTLDEEGLLVPEAGTKIVEARRLIQDVLGRLELLT